MDETVNADLEKVRLKTQETLRYLRGLEFNVPKNDPRVISIFNEVNGRGIENVPDDEFRGYVVREFKLL